MKWCDEIEVVGPGACICMQHGSSILEARWDHVMEWAWYAGKRRQCRVRLNFMRHLSSFHVYVITD